MTTKASSATTTAVNGTQLSLVAIIRGKRGLGDEGASSCHSSRPRACQNRATSTTTCNRSNDDPDVCFFMRTGRHVLILRRISNCLTYKAFPKVLPEVLESEMDLRHWFDGYEDCMKIEEKSWHALFASMNMVMQAY